MNDNLTAMGELESEGSSCISTIPTVWKESF